MKSLCTLVHQERKEASNHLEVGSGPNSTAYRRTGKGIRGNMFEVLEVTNHETDIQAVEVPAPQVEVSDWITIEAKREIRKKKRGEKEASIFKSTLDIHKLPLSQKLLPIAAPVAKKLLMEEGLKSACNKACCGSTPTGKIQRRWSKLGAVNSSSSIGTRKRQEIRR